MPLFLDPVDGLGGGAGFAPADGALPASAYLLLNPFFEKPSKVINGESWDIVQTGQGPSSPYLSWDAYQKIHNLLLL